MKISTLSSHAIRFGAALAPILFFCQACTTATPQISRTPSTAIRSALGRVEVVGVDGVEGIAIPQQYTREDLLDETIPNLGLPQPEEWSPTTVIGLSAILAISAPGELIRSGIVGARALTADSEAEAKRNREGMESAVGAIDLTTELRDRVANALDPNSRSAASEPVETRIQLRVLRPALKLTSGGPAAQDFLGREVFFGGGRKYALNLIVEMRVLDARTGGLLQFDYVNYRGPSAKMSDWAQDDALALREEVARAVNLLAETIIARNFAEEPIDRAESKRLAQLGITRPDALNSQPFASRIGVIAAPTPTAPRGVLFAQAAK